MADDNGDDTQRPARPKLFLVRSPAQWYCAHESEPDPNATPVPDAAVIAALERAYSYARSGRLASIAIVYVASDNGWGHIIGGNGWAGNPAALLGAVYASLQKMTAVANDGCGHETEPVDHDHDHDHDGHDSA